MVTSLPPDEASLEELLAIARQRFSVAFKPVRIGEQTLEIASIANMTDYLDKLANQSRQGKNIQLPLWAKIWPASTLLALTMTQIPPARDKRVLEIGAGLGIPALIAASRGWHTTISDTHEDALLMIRINILANNLQDKAIAMPLDITTQDTDTPFDLILGSELFGIKESSASLIRCLQSNLAPGGMALLARDTSRKEHDFCKQAAAFFDIGVKQVGCQDVQGEVPLQAHLYRLVPKQKVNNQ
ncbi:MAG: methyltransferase [Deltaproteobacteria bacterium]|nr:MAG: methyltransferase [Deltaproteobacteria bacterium]